MKASSGSGLWPTVIRRLLMRILTSGSVPVVRTAAAFVWITASDQTLLIAGELEVAFQFDALIVGRMLPGSFERFVPERRLVGNLGEGLQALDLLVRDRGEVDFERLAWTADDGPLAEIGEFALAGGLAQLA